MGNYDSTNYNPPAPIALVKVINPNTNSEASDVPMLLDTGADISSVSASIISKLSIPIEESAMS